MLWSVLTSRTVRLIFLDQGGKCLKTVTNVTLLLLSDHGDMDEVEALPPNHKLVNGSTSLALGISPDKGRWMKVCYP